VELLNLGIEIVEGWYSVGNTEYDVGILRFKDFIRMVNFFWVCAYLLRFWVAVTFGFSKNSRLR
jgi:hypothetical protein